MALKDDLIAYWKMEETSGTRADSHASFDLTDNNTVGSATGISGTGADFENTTRTNAEFLSNNDVRDGQTGDMSISAWVKFEEFGPFTEYIAAKWLTTGNQRAFQFYYNTEPATNTLTFDYTSDGTTSNRVAWTSDADPFAITTWYHVVVTVDVSAETVVMYVDGSSIAITKTIDNGTATTMKDSTTSFKVGSQSNDGTFHYFDGVIDEFAIWNRIITSAEVTEIYAAGAGKFYDAWDAGGAAVVYKNNTLSLMGVG